MKLASLKGPGRDGTLCVVSRDLARAAKVDGIAPTLQQALENWPAAEAKLRDAFDRLAYTHRKEHVRAIEEAKKPETRARRIEKALEMIGGM